MFREQIFLGSQINVRVNVTERADVESAMISEFLSSHTQTDSEDCSK